MPKRNLFFVGKIIIKFKKKKTRGTGHTHTISRAHLFGNERGALGTRKGERERYEIFFSCVLGSSIYTLLLPSICRDSVRKSIWNNGRTSSWKKGGKGITIVSTHWSVSSNIIFLFPSDYCLFHPPTRPNPQRLLFLCYPSLDFRIARTVASWPFTMPLNERLLIPHTHTDTVCTYVWWGTHKSREKRWWLTPGRRMNRSMTLNNSRIPFLAIQQSHPIKSGKKPTVSLYRRDTKEGRRASPPTFQAT
jgi:hypothetical protein